LRVLVVPGLKEDVNQQVTLAIVEEFSNLLVQQVDIDQLTNSNPVWPEVDIVVTTGKIGCLAALQHATTNDILCTLLTEESFRSIESAILDTTRRNVTALVIDQPAIRQALVANRVYPALAEFSVFAGAGIGNGLQQPDASLKVIPFSEVAALPAQLRDALNNRDALIATSESSIFNTTTLSTVLLTAYGFGKPVIGFSRAYVNAGALITCYSTPALIMRQIAQRLTVETESGAANPELIYPEYFSVVDNPSVARSLGLVKNFSFSSDEAYTDQDFAR
jgi:ABC-type uncharacterized transport system substrate-binding protein